MDCMNKVFPVRNKEKNATPLPEDLDFFSHWRDIGLIFEMLATMCTMAMNTSVSYMSLERTPTEMTILLSRIPVKNMQDLVGVIGIPFKDKKANGPEVANLTSSRMRKRFCIIGRPVYIPRTWRNDNAVVELMAKLIKTRMEVVILSQLTSAPA